LDPLRQLVLDLLLARLVEHPATVAGLAGEAARLAERADHAERLAEMGRMASAVAHEVRHPLGGILAQAQRRDGGGPDARRGAGAGRFVAGLLRYAGPRRLESEEVDVAAEPRRAVEDVRRARGVAEERVVVSAEGERPAHADRAAVGDVVRILVDNAVLAGE